MNSLKSHPNSVNDVKPTSHWYDRTNKGPFIVFARKLGERNTSKSLSIIEASRLLLKANIKFNLIEFHAWNTWKIAFDSFQDANLAISNKFLPKLGLTLYIPKYKISQRSYKRNPM